MKTVMFLLLGLSGWAVAGIMVSLETDPPPHEVNDPLPMDRTQQEPTQAQITSEQPEEAPVKPETQTPQPVPSALLGTYRRLPVQNSYHTGSISEVDGTLTWTNKAGVSWPLYPDMETATLHTDESNPYYQTYGFRAFFLEMADDTILGFWFQGERYVKDGANWGNPPPPNDATEF